MGMVLQMTWQPSLLKLIKRKHGSPPLGLRNIGNNCYLNSVLQCLTYTPPLASFCLRNLHSSICDLGAGKEKKGDCPFCILEKRIVRSLSSEAVSDAPLKINNCLRLYAAHFRSGRQEDAHEFLRYLIDACHNTCLRLKKLQQQHHGVKNGIANGGEVGGAGETVVKDIFGGALQSQVKCLSCGVESNKVDDIMDISLDILHSGTLKEALQKFFQPEVLDGNNKYKCDNCKELVAARKQMSILQAPNVLVIQLKRFEGMFGGKVDKAIAFDEILVLSRYMCKASQDLHPEYNLFGTIVHSGFSPDSGHYYAYIKDAFGRWYCCNDSYVSVSTLQEVLSEKVYVLFFSRTKQRPHGVDMASNGSKSHESNGSKANGFKSHESNGFKASTTQKSDVVEKPVCSQYISNNNSDKNNSSNFHECNGTKTSSQKSGFSEKPFIMKISAKRANTSNSITHLASNGSKTATLNGSDHVETPVRVKGLSDYHPETKILIPSLGSNGSNSARVQNSSVLVESVNVRDSSNHHRQAKEVIGAGSTNEPLASGSTKIGVYKRESGKENGCTSPTSTSIDKVKSRLPVNEGNGVSKTSINIKKSSQSYQGVIGGQNGTCAVDSLRKSSPDFNSSKTTTESQKSLGCQDLRNGDVGGSSNNSGTKRKTADGHQCILLARDAKSRAEVEDFKELIGKEASAILRSCGWSDEVHKFMHARKRVCQQAENTALNDHEKKGMLISDAKRDFISKIPESLKARLVENLKAFSKEKRPSGTC